MVNGHYRDIISDDKTTFYAFSCILLKYVGISWYLRDMLHVSCYLRMYVASGAARVRSDSSFLPGMFPIA